MGDLCIDDRVILREMGCIEQAWDKFQRKLFVNAVINFQVS
jgi:hypothetical protein